MIICSNCHHENRKSAKFCENCGSPLEITCPNCGTINRAGAKFCDNCGTRLGQKEIIGEVSGSISNATTPSPLKDLIPQDFAFKLETARTERSMVGERRIVTIMFCDVRGSTEAASHLDPEEWAEIVNGTFECMIAPVYRYEGTVARLMGDGILAFFGAPIAHEDDPQRAVLSGLDILKTIQPYREEVRKRWGVDFDLRVGINTGLVMVGQVGSDLQMEYTALGDAINLAARMEQTAKPGSLQVAEDCYKLVAPIFEWEDLGEITVKGKDDPVHVYRPLKQREGHVRLRGLESHGINSPLVGREAELDLLHQRLEALQTGRGSFVLVIGEAGMGKSRLISELRPQAPVLSGEIQNTTTATQGTAMEVGNDPSRILPEQAVEPRQPQFSWLEGETLSYRHASSYYPWRQAISQAIGAGVSDPASLVREKLQHTCNACSFPGSDIHFLEALLAVESEETSELIKSLEGDALLGHITEATRGFISGLAQNNPLVITFDDLHWADEASLDLLFNLADVTRLYPIFIIGLMRPDKKAPSWTFRQRLQEKLGIDYAEITLSPLPESTSRSMLANLLAFDQLPESMRALILSKSEGNPFFIEEVVRSLMDSGEVVQEVDAQTGGIIWGSRSKVADIQIPENLQTLLTARIDRLETETRQTLQLASVIGRSFYYRVLEAIQRSNGNGKNGLDQQLLNLQKAELILESARDPELEYAFRHSLTQEAAYNTILIKQRREFHLRVGNAIEALFKERLEEFYPVLAHHFSEAGDRRALKYEILAGEVAFRLYALVEAIKHYSRALDLVKVYRLPDSIDLPRMDLEVTDLLTHIYLRLGRCHELQTEFREAFAIYEGMLSMAKENHDQHLELAALLAQATVYAIPNEVQNTEKAMAFAGDSLSLSRQLGDKKSEAKALWIQQLSIMYSGKMDQSVPYGEASVALARQVGLKAELAHALQDLARGYMAIGELKKARSVLEEAQPIWEELGNQAMLSENWSSLSHNHFLTGEFEASMAFSQKSYDLSTRIKNEWGRATSGFYVAWVYWAVGDIDHALELLKSNISIAKELGHPATLGNLIQMSWIFDSLGAEAEAFQAAQEAKDVVSTVNPFYQYALDILASLYIHAGELTKAKELIQQGDEIGRTHLILANDILKNMGKIEYHMAKGEAKQANRILEDLLDLISKSGTRFFFPQALRLKASLLEREDKWREANQVLREAQQKAEEIGMKMELWRILARMARVERHLGNTQEAERLGDSALQVVEQVLDNISDPDLADTFKSLANQQIYAGS